MPFQEDIDWGWREPLEIGAWLLPWVRKGFGFMLQPSTRLFLFGCLWMIFCPVQAWERAPGGCWLGGLPGAQSCLFSFSGVSAECPKTSLPQAMIPARAGQGLSIRGHSKAGCSQDRDVGCEECPACQLCWSRQRWTRSWGDSMALPPPHASPSHCLFLCAPTLE